MATANVRLGRAFIDFIARDQSLVAGVRRTGQSLRRHRRAIRNVRRDYTALTKAAGNFRQAVLGGNGALLATVGISAGLVGAVRHFIELSDQAVLLEARVRLVAKSTEDYRKAIGGIRTIAREVKVPIAGLIDLYQRFGRASRRGADDLLPIVRGLAQAGVISGATSQEIRNGLIQLAQGIAANRLGGDELRAVFEQIPRVAQAIADGLGVSIGFLREISKEGLLGTKLVLAGLERELPTLEREFLNIPLTVGRALTDINNEIFHLVASLNSVTGVTTQVVGAIEAARDAIRSQRTFDALVSAITFVSNGFATLLNNIDLVAHALAGFAVLAFARSPLGRLLIDVQQLIFSFRALSAVYQAVGRGLTQTRDVFRGTRLEIARLQVRARQLARSWTLNINPLRSLRNAFAGTIRAQRRGLETWLADQRRAAAQARQTFVSTIRAQRSALNTWLQSQRTVAARGREVFTDSIRAQRATLNSFVARQRATARGLFLALRQTAADYRRQIAAAQAQGSGLSGGRLSIFSQVPGAGRFREQIREVRASISQAVFVTRQGIRSRVAAYRVLEDQARKTAANVAARWRLSINQQVASFRYAEAQAAAATTFMAARWRALIQRQIASFRRFEANVRFGWSRITLAASVAARVAGTALRVGIAGGAAAAAIAVRSLLGVMGALVRIVRTFSGLFLIEGAIFAVNFFRNLSKEAEAAGKSIVDLSTDIVKVPLKLLAVEAIRIPEILIPVFVTTWDLILEGFSGLWGQIFTDAERNASRVRRILEGAAGGAIAGSFAGSLFGPGGTVLGAKLGALLFGGAAAIDSVRRIARGYGDAGGEAAADTFSKTLIERLKVYREEQTAAIISSLTPDQKIVFDSLRTSLGDLGALYRTLFSGGRGLDTPRARGNQPGDAINERKEAIRLARLDFETQVKGADNVTQAQVRVNRAYLEVEQRLARRIALLGRNRQEALEIQEIQRVQAPVLRTILDIQTKIEGKTRQIASANKVLGDLITRGDVVEGYEIKLHTQQEVVREYEQELRHLVRIQKEQRGHLKLLSQLPPAIQTQIAQLIAAEADNRAGQEARRRIRQLVRDTNTPLQEYRLNVDAVNRAWKDTSLNLTSVEIAQARVAAQMQFIRDSGREVKGVMDQAAAALQNVGSIGSGSFQKIANAVSQTISLVKNLSDLLNSLAQLIIKLSSGTPTGGFLGGLTNLLARLGTLGAAGVPPTTTPPTGTPAATAAVTVSGATTVTTQGVTTVNAAGTVKATGPAQITGPVTIGDVQGLSEICRCIMEAGQNTISAIIEQTTVLSADIQNSASQIIGVMQSIAAQQRTEGLMKNLAQGALAAGAQGRQYGGSVRRNQPYWVGEGGQAELFVPQANGFIIPQNRLRGGMVFQQTINFQGSRQDFPAFLQEVLPSIDERSNELLRQNTRRASPEREALQQVRR